MKKKNKILSSLNILSIAGVSPYKLKPEEEYMNEKQLFHFKKILQSWRKQLINENSHNISYIPNEMSKFSDPIDRAVQEEEFNFNLRNKDRERKLIKKIEVTLIKIKQNNFGYCQSCGIEIGLKRLEARPTAHLCIDCKTLAEIREKQIAG
ncbi:RNA polymerase-binding protein DksA [Enterobacteriaceae endosymbiont of Plateumaris braccata]|uniref:RNA polymerase-binding protein DksA n=1 Tax=Enterobacteriaceae endosymbiont of Plateumaris braccata TaxID=2675793 RepID=UPI0014494668|nr:RNA polymerase-binding protein DksA [Enterobacteriaceae endosymbiont of Plateumaris braccata]QJC28207.1 RNA polymerase-binding protein DksA [Enterobacteriaceae endosymbiont of Plateumaris braccata]